MSLTLSLSSAGGRLDDHVELLVRVEFTAEHADEVDVVTDTELGSGSAAGRSVERHPLQVHPRSG
jgi:hypothetical protein